MRREPRKGQGLKRAALLGLLLVLIWLWRSCQPVAVPPPAPQVTAVPRPRATLIPTNGRDAQISEPHRALEEAVMSELRKRRAELNQCVEQAGDPGLVYTASFLWNSEGGLVDWQLVPSPSGALRDCLDALLTPIRVPADPGMRERRLSVDLRVQ